VRGWRGGAGGAVAARAALAGRPAVAGVAGTGASAAGAGAAAVGTGALGDETGGTWPVELSPPGRGAELQPAIASSRPAVIRCRLPIGMVRRRVRNRGFAAADEVLRAGREMYPGVAFCHLSSISGWGLVRNECRKVARN